jgi:cytochrome b pre-mRNA-processing protein 3
MIFGLFRKSAATDAVYAVYSSIVAQSRQPHLYAEWGVPDTVTGRFDMICLHLALLLRRLRGEGKDAAAFSQALFDLFFKDMDRSHREMGVTDLGVPKKIQKIGNVFYGLLASLNEALDTGDAARVEEVLRRNVYADGDAVGAASLAAYLLQEAAELAAISTHQIVAGRLERGVAA